MLLKMLQFYSLQAGDVPAEGVDMLIESLKSHTYVPQRDPTGPLVYAVDHCFSIRGQGTIMTGTVLSGSVAVNDVSLWIV